MAVSKVIKDFTTPPPFHPSLQVRKKTLSLEERGLR
jgi:hypothetical protein